MFNLADYELVASVEECGDGFGVMIYVRRPKALLDRLANLSDECPGGALSEKEKERSLFYRVEEEALRLLKAQDARLDPKTYEVRTEVRAEFEQAFKYAGLGPIFMEEVSNEYWPQAYPDMLQKYPWFNVTTRLGHFKIGWRKRVIEINWERTLIMKLPQDRLENLFSKEDVTKGDKSAYKFVYIHAWGIEKATQYLRMLVDVYDLDTGGGSDGLHRGAAQAAR